MSNPTKSNPTKLVPSLNRRDFLRGSVLIGGGVIGDRLLSAAPGASTEVQAVARRIEGTSAGVSSPAIITPENARPLMPFGVASGDVTRDRAIIWSRSDRPARMMVEYATDSAFKDVRRIIGPAALESSDFTARVDLRDLPPDQQIFYRVSFQDLASPRIVSAPHPGQFHTAPAKRREIRFGWSGDLVGQGWGINPDLGGMQIFESLRRQGLEFFINSGDMIYADGPLKEQVMLEDGRIWKNIVTPEKAKVAESLDEFWGNYRYNLLDEHYRRFNAEVPQLVQWDDHETRNNWYPGGMLEDPRYHVKSCDLLAARARRAFLDYTPIRINSDDPERIYRHFSYGPQLEVFMLDMRSWRGANSTNQQTTEGPETEFLGQAQIQWLKSALLASKSTWKVIAADMPLGLIVPDADGKQEGVSNADGPAMGRELELAGLLRFIKQHRIRNLVWLTADVHYAAAHYYDPKAARFTDFHPFWEFVAGPLNAGTFGPNVLDNTFGPQLKFISLPPGMKPNRSPLDGHQFFGTVRLDDKTDVMTVKLHSLKGDVLYSVDLTPEN